MNKFQRKLYATFFVALFFIIAPLIILFAKGYRFDAISKVFVHSGSIIIKSTPRKIDIFVDGKKISPKRLSFINNYYIINGIRPGKHNVRCQKEGYNTWQKNVAVHSGLSTEFWNVLLTPLDIKKEKVSSNVKDYFFSPRSSDELVLYHSGDEGEVISLFNQKTKEERIVYQGDPEGKEKVLFRDGENVEWASGHKKILIPISKEGRKDYLVVSFKGLKKESKVLSLQDIFDELLMAKSETLNTKKETKLKEGDKRKKTKVETERKGEYEIYQARWSFGEDDKLLVLTKSHQLYLLDIVDVEKSVLVDENVLGFDLAGNHLYYLKEDDGFIWDVGLGNVKKKKKVARATIENEEGDFLKLITYDEYRQALITNDKLLYVFNKDAEKESEFFGKIADGINGVQFSDDGKKLLYWSDNEISVYMLRDWLVQPDRNMGEKIFITRFSTGVANVQWMQNFENIIFTNRHFIKIAELDNRDKINLLTVFVNSQDLSLGKCLYNKDNFKLYISEKKSDDNSNYNLSELQIIDEEKNLLGL